MRPSAFTDKHIVCMSARLMLAAGAVLCTCAVALPVTLPHNGSPIADEACLGLSNLPLVDATPTDALERCSSLYPTDVDLLAMVGSRYERARQNDRAEAVYRQVLDLEPDYADVRLRLGVLLLNRGAATDAAREARIALATQPHRRALVDLLRDAEARAAEARKAESSKGAERAAAR